MYTQEEVLTLMCFSKVLGRRPNDKKISLLSYLENAYCLIKENDVWKIQNGNTNMYYDSLIEALYALINYTYTNDHNCEYQEFDLTIELWYAKLIDKENNKTKKMLIQKYLKNK